MTGLATRTIKKTDQRINSLTILQRVAKGDQLAVRECLAKYSKLVWFLARKFTKTREDAEDVTQEIFIDIWKSAARFDPTKSPEQAFVMLISRRRLIDCLRKAKRYPLTLSFDGTEKKQSSEDYKRLHMYVEMKLAVDALNKLNIHEKRIIKMSVYGGISNREIAQTVRLSIGTVKSQIWRDLQKIRKSIDLPTYSPL